MTSEEDIQRKIVFEAIRMVKSGILEVLEVKRVSSFFFETDPHSKCLVRLSAGWIILTFFILLNRLVMAEAVISRGFKFENIPNPFDFRVSTGAGDFEVWNSLYI